MDHLEFRRQTGEIVPHFLARAPALRPRRGGGAVSQRAEVDLLGNHRQPGVDTLALALVPGLIGGTQPRQDVAHRSRAPKSRDSAAWRAVMLIPPCDPGAI